MALTPNARRAANAIRSATAYAKNIPKQIVLIDGERLSELLVRYGVGVRVDRTIDVQRLDEDFFEE